MIFNLKGDYTTEKETDSFLSVNSCGIEVLTKFDLGCRRLKGRSDYHILYIQEGTCYVRASHADPESSKDWIPVPRGSVIFYRPWEPQEYYFLMKDQSISHYIHFTGTGCEEILQELALDQIRIFSIGNSSEYEELSSRMVQEYTMKSVFWEHTCAAYLYELLCIIARKKSLRISNVGYSGEHRIHRACRRIYENMDNPPKVSELAEECCLSVSRFSHLFREITGKSPVEFTQTIRLERAKELLSTTDLTVCEIAERLNFYDQNYFSRVFKRWLNISPTEWRALSRKMAESPSDSPEEKER